MLTTTSNLPSDKQCNAYCNVMGVLRNQLLIPSGHQIIHIGTKLRFDGSYEITIYVPEEYVEECTGRYEEIQDEINQYAPTFSVSIHGLKVEPNLLTFNLVNYTMPLERKQPVRDQTVLDRESFNVTTPVEETVEETQTNKKQCRLFSCFS